MTDFVVHRIGRQRLELRVANEAAAREVHARLSSEFQSRVGPVLDEVFTAACPRNVTVRVDRLEIDVGTVSRDGLMGAIAVAMRQQLAAWLRAVGDDERADVIAPEEIAAIEPSGRHLSRRLSEEEIALERLAMFLEHGVTTWRDTDFTRDTLEAMLLDLIDSAPGALRRLLQQAPPVPVAGRIRAQLTVAGRHRLLAWLGVADPADLDRVMADWTAVLAALEHPPGSVAPAPSSERVAAWLFERIWSGLLAGRRVDAAGAAVGQHVLTTLMPDAWAAASAPLLEVLLVTAERLLPRDNHVVRFLAERAARIDLERRLDAESRLPSPPDARFGPVVDEASDEAHEDRRAPSHEAATDDAIGDDGATPDDGATGDVDEAVGASDDPEDMSPAATATRGRSPKNIGAERCESNSTAMSVAGSRIDADPVDAARQRAVARVQEAVRSQPSTRRAHTTFATEPLWAAHAGAVIVWPFLPAFFEACGLTAAKRFMDDAARERAVLLTAHLASGLQEWVESDLLLEKTLCGCPGDEAIAPAIELRDDERQQAGELLASVIGHWAALKSTSIDGLRRAFLCRAGTMTAIASGWKLEIPRAGHDVLLDALPWGIGLVLLPWMEQPLHVEW